MASTPRGPLSRRFEAGVLRRLDQALGHAPEPIQPALPPDVISVRRGFAEPVAMAESFAAVIFVLAGEACALLTQRGLGVRTPERVDGSAQVVRVGTARPVCVNASRWDCMLEPAGGLAGGGWAVRLGLRTVKGLGNGHAAGLLAHRGTVPYGSVEEVWRRAGTPAAVLARLAEADAFHGVGLDRRQALWQAQGLADAVLPLFAAADAQGAAPEGAEPPVPLAPMRAGREVVEDHRVLGLSLRRHPVAFLRQALRARGMAACADLAHLRDGSRVVVPGLVLMRQKPGSAKGVMFVTVEDETGVANLVLWPDRFAQQRALVLSATMLACHGRVQREGDVVHVITERLEDLSGMLRSVGGRDEKGEGRGCSRIRRHQARHSLNFLRLPHLVSAPARSTPRSRRSASCIGDLLRHTNCLNNCEAGGSAAVRNKQHAAQHRF